MATSSERSMGYIRKFPNVGGRTVGKCLEPLQQVGISPKLLTPTVLPWKHSKTFITICEDADYAQEQRARLYQT